MSSNEITIIVVILISIIMSACFRLDHRVLIVTALGLIMSSAIVMLKNMEDLAQQLVIFAFYFLLVGVVLLFIDYVRDNSTRGE